MANLTGAMRNALQTFGLHSRPRLIHIKGPLRMMSKYKSNGVYASANTRDSTREQGPRNQFDRKTVRNQLQEKINKRVKQENDSILTSGEHIYKDTGTSVQSQATRTLHDILKKRTVTMDDESAKVKHVKEKSVQPHIKWYLTDTIQQAVATNNQCDWEKIHKEIPRNMKSAENWSTVAMLELRSTNDHHRSSNGLELLRYIRKNDTPSYACVSFLVQLLGLDGFNSGHEDTICHLFEELTKFRKHFEPITGFAIVCGISKTRKWKECVRIMEDFNLFSECDRSSCKLAEAAFHYGEPEMGFNLLEKVQSKSIKTTFTDDVYLKILEKQEGDHSEGHVFQMLNLMRDYEVIPSEKVALAIGDFFCRDGNFTQGRTSVKNNNLCGHCGNYMEKPLELTSAQFKELKEAYKENAMLRKNVFFNSTPEEVQGFFKFMKSLPECDVVIDGLNAQCIKCKENVSNELKLLTAVQTWKRQGLNVLVITRTHAKKYNRHLWSKIEGMARCFTVSNKSKDDPFMIYAALLSGPRTYIATNDELRDHQYLMETKELRRYFLRWQRQHQIVPVSMSKPTKGEAWELQVEYPPKFGIFVQQSSDGRWHIPYEDGSERASYQLPNSWICIERKSK